MTDNEKKSEWIENNLKKPRNIKGFKGPRPKYVIIDEILRIPDEDATVNQIRKDFYSHELPTGYVPPFPTGSAEERLAAWQAGNRKAMAAEINHLVVTGQPLSPEEWNVAKTLLPLNEDELGDFYKKLNEELGPEPLGGDKLEDDS